MSRKAPFRVESDGRNIHLGRVQFRVYMAFLTGRKFTGADLCEVCKITDPRGHIAALRGKGLPISAIWMVNPDTGNRCKQYFLDYEK